MSELNKLKEVVKQPETEPNREIARCDLCDNEWNVYFCEDGHKTLFCRDCLFDVIKTDSRHGDWQNIEFKAKCNKEGACNFKPLNLGGIASRPFERQTEEEKVYEIFLNIVKKISRLNPKLTNKECCEEALKWLQAKKKAEIINEQGNKGQEVRVENQG